jgi:hypothetical protein
MHAFIADPIVIDSLRGYLCKNGVRAQELDDTVAEVQVRAVEALQDRKPYFELKVAELHLVHEHREKVHEEKEEQKRVKEQMKEEIRARDEIEKAQAEAEKEEAQYEKALAKARTELEAAQGANAITSAKQTEKLEALVTRLENQLKETLDRKAKAIARAQLTRSGHVGLLAGFLGSKRITVGCLNCGHQWAAGEQGRILPRGGGCVLVIAAVLFFGFFSRACRHTSSDTTETTTEPTAARTAASPGLDAVDLFEQKYGTPDVDDTTAGDTPVPPIVTRWVVYKKEHVRMTFVFDRGAGGWQPLAPQDDRTKQPISVDEMERRLKSRIRK